MISFALAIKASICRASFSRYRLPSESMVIAWKSLLFSGVAEEALGSVTFMPRICVIERLTSMKHASRKNMMSISGMISMRAFFGGMGELSFITSLRLQLLHHHFDVGGLGFEVEA